jgi:peptide/nickel transport system permease protein
VAPRRRRRRWRGAVVLLRRLLFYVATAWVAITLNFVIPRLMPGDPATIVVNRLAQRQPVTAATETAIRALFGTPDESLWRQYLQYIGELAHGNFGISIAFYPQPVATVIAQGLPWTLALVGLSTVLAFLIGTLLGVVAGMRPGNRFDSIFAPRSSCCCCPYSGRSFPPRTAPTSASTRDGRRSSSAASSITARCRHSPSSSPRWAGGSWACGT